MKLKHKIRMIKNRNATAMKIARKIETVRPLECFSCTTPFCCKSKKGIYTLGYETVVIKGLITPTQRQRAKKSTVEKVLKGHYTCPMLGEDGKCEIYELRPLSCSTYFVADERINPKEDNEDRPHLCEKPKDIVGYVYCRVGGLEKI